MCQRPELYELDLKDIDTVAVDLETYDPELKTKGSGAVRNKGFVCGIAIATGKQTLYFPIRHDYTSDNHDPKQTWNILNKKLFQNKDIRKVFHNAMYDVCWIRAETGQMPKGELLDTMIAASIIDENKLRYSLDAISKEYLKEIKYKYTLQDKALENHKIKDPLNNMHKLSYETVYEYAHQDVNLTLKLWKIFEKKLDEILYEDDEFKNKKTLRNIFNLETRLFPCLVDMKFKGVRVDVEKAKQFSNKLETERDQLIQEIKKDTGVKIEIWAAASIKKLLNQQQITDYKTTPKSELPQLPKHYLKTHKNKNLRKIARARECDKAKSAFVEGLLKYVHKGRIHADINQIRSEKGGTVTGRFSMSNPNLQQIPTKGPVNIRELFIPEEGKQWCSFDYSQQEPRIVVNYAIKILRADKDTPEYILKSVAELEKEYKNKDADFHQIVAEMAEISRDTAKTINLALFYGMGKMKLEQELNLSAAEAKDLFKKYHERVPFVRKLSQVLTTFAILHKLVYTLEDRFCRFNKWEPIDKQWNNKERKFEVSEQIWDEEIKKFRMVYKPVPLLSEEEAKLRFKAKQTDADKKKDPGCKDFEKKYQPAFTYKALNKLVQGSAADMTKKAMVDLYEKGILPHIQIHDELCISIKNEEERDTIKTIMEEAIKLEIPNKVDYLSGPNWGKIQ